MTDELKAIRARHEACGHTIEWPDFDSFEAHNDRATLLRLLDAARAEASAMKDAYSGASEDKFIERKWRQEAEAKLRLNQAASKMLGDDVLEVMDADDAAIASLQAELDAAREELRQRGDGWRDISTAPKDQLIDIWIKNSANGTGVRWTSCYYDQICDQWRTAPGGHLMWVPAKAVSHWRSLPNPPSDLTRAQGESS